MTRIRLLLLALAMTVAACAPATGDGFQFVDQPEPAGTAFHTIVGQTAFEVTPGDEVWLFLASDPDVSIDQFSTQSFLACDTSNWAIEHAVAAYLADVSPAEVTGLLGSRTDIEDGDVVSGVGFIVAETVRSGSQMVVDPKGYDHYFEFEVVEPTL
ncbi:MAG: hypothetical protein GY898_04105 [Proteobacteria bacterium]|nr:hypothetical protein [Pseudomonadota bacterium]